MSQSRTTNVSRPQRSVVSFGPFRLFPAERLIEKSGTPVNLGGRALDILLVLVEHAGEVVTKSELLARVWQGVSVEEVALRVHIANLRKALGDGDGDARYVTNVAGRGYCFTGAPDRAPAPQQASLAQAESTSSRSPLPRLRRMIGRDELVAALAGAVGEKRFVTIAVPGGIGKTTVAIAIAHALLPAFANAVRFIDLTTATGAALCTDQSLYHLVVGRMVNISLERGNRVLGRPVPLRIQRSHSVEISRGI